VKEAIQKTLIFSAIAIPADVCGCLAGVATDDVPPMTFRCS
jgi:hypothetical protein